MGINRGEWQMRGAYFHAGAGRIDYLTAAGRAGINS
jgi:hypothetical protein